MCLTNKVAIVTGGGRGIGKSVAIALAQQGADVVLAARTRNEIQTAAEEIQKIGRESVAVRADISVETDVRKLVSQTLRKFGRIDILVNNAGIGWFSRVADLKIKDFDAMWAVNVRGVFLCTRAVLPVMSKQRSGDIVNISSLAGRNAFVGGAGYAATKWALIGFSRCLMLEVRSDNIRVITVCPGSVDTTFGNRTFRKEVNPKGMPKAADVAKVVVDALQMPSNVMVSEIDIRPTIPPG